MKTEPKSLKDMFVNKTAVEVFLKCRGRLEGRPWVVGVASYRYKLLHQFKDMGLVNIEKKNKATKASKNIVTYTEKGFNLYDALDKLYHGVLIELKTKTL